MKSLVLSLFVASVLLVAAPALADDPRPIPAATPAPRGGPVLRLPEKHIYGEVHRPMVIFVLERSQVDFSPPNLRTSFVDRILRTTEPLQ
ncbi:MAG: hypothetical protein HYY06_19350 [Deltaproteobacteria bacterium]|nr:hypothetical protein [Deltaproteobacteria bacterium]